MFAKPVAQLITNLFVSRFIRQVGYANVYMTGGLILGVSALTMTLYHDLQTLVLSRTFQGVGSSFGTVSGLGMIGSYYDEDVARINNMGRAMSGLALGVLVGPPFSAICVEFFGDEWPFIILCGMSFFLLLLGAVIRYQFILPVHTHSSVIDLLKEKKIFVTVLIVLIANLPVSALETGQPLFIEKIYKQRGILLKGLSFLPTTIGYSIGSNFIGRFFDWFGGLVTTSAIGIGCSIFGLFIYSSIGSITVLKYILVLMCMANLLIGFGVGLIDNSQFSLLGLLFKYGDFGNNYGSIFALGDVSFCLAFTIGPLLTGNMAEIIGFPNTLELFALLLLVSTPLFFSLRGNLFSSEMSYERLPEYLETARPTVRTRSSKSRSLSSSDYMSYQAMLP